MASKIQEEDLEDSTDSEESSDSEDVEPTLKYERIGNDLTKILERDAASCMAVHPKFIALGTHWGLIHILDLEGNKTRSKEKLHTTTVNQISIDDNGDYIASCSDDGRVVITGLYNIENNQTINFDRPIKAVALDPLFFQQNSGKRFITGDTKLELNEKGFFGRSSQVLHQGEGPVRNIKWKSHYIAWSNDLGVKIYDTSCKQRITFIAREDTKLRPELYRCSLCWRNDRTLIIAWGRSIKICMVKDRSHNDARDLPSRYVEIVGLVSELEYMVSGLAPHGDDLAVVTYSEDEVQHENGKLVAPRPHLRILKVSMYECEELSNDALSIRGFDEYRCNDYHLESLVEECMYFVVSPKDVVVAKQRDQDDHITWLLSHDQFDEALAVAYEHAKQLKKFTPYEVGRQYLDHLIEEEEFDRAGQLCMRVLGKNKELWEQEVYKFARINRLEALARYLPLNEPRLSPGIYEMVLNTFLQKNQQEFQSLIRDWPCDVYHIQTLVNAVSDKLDRDHTNRALLECLGDLYKYDKRYDRALGIYIRLREPKVFELIHKHNLFSSISDKIIMLMDFDKPRAVDLFIDNMDKIPVAKVVEQLDKAPALLHVYLDRLLKKDPVAGQDYHHRQVWLYAEYDRARLLPFLRRSSHYPLQQALEECERREFIPEMVFLLGRMGNTKQALQLIMTELKDVSQAIDFCKEHSDKELWEDLIHFSIDKPDFITGLLNNIGTHVDPIILIQKIRSGMKIPGLRDSLVRILQDYNLQISLRDGCKKILVSDCFSLLEKQVKTQKRGISVTSQNRCQSCQQELIVRDPRYMSNVVVFFCHHAFHEDCLPAHNLESCMLCNTSQKRSPGAYSSQRR